MPAGMTHASSDGELWSAFLADPLDGLARIYDGYSRMVYGLARTIVAHPQDAEDLTHEVFTSLLGRCNYDPGRGTLASYLIAMTRSRAIDRVRARGRSLRLLSAWARLDPAVETKEFLPIDDVVQGEQAEAVRAALAALPSAQRKVIELAYFRGLSQSEIAAELDAPLGTVKTHVRQGLSMLRAALAPFLD